MVPRRKSGRTSLGIHLAVALKRNALRASVPFDPSRVVGVTEIHGRNAVGIASYESIMSRATEMRKWCRKVENGSPIPHLETAGLASRAGADVEGCSGFS